MIQSRPRTPLGYLPILLPAFALIAFYIVPFGSMVGMSFFHNLGGGAYEQVFTLENYARLVSPFFLSVLGTSFEVAFLVALFAIVIGFPFTYLLVNARRGTQVFWLIVMLSVLSLSEAIIGFAWSTLLSRTAGIGVLFEALGLTEKAQSYAPSLGAVLAGVTYIAMPYAVLLLYPILSRIEPDIEQASRTLGASPLRAFFNVIVPMHRTPIVVSFVMIFVFTLGSYLLPQILGRPTNWTLSVVISDQALLQSNMPFAAALSIFLMTVTILLVLLVTLINRKGAKA
ncbi:ABC transporter permease [Salipiger mangrovisoli]|uniref:ABC transporter permease n=1 Tax=Salipiger mangrovisoli TaxID=2865933 RepID=A0ABR9WYN7_9RHOB|nr:ABC transporter permease [Salipiger mangrovisoli]MBE9636402.1 ABC transporter permease [Salipiger mangrovisoli]